MGAPVTMSRAYQATSGPQHFNEVIRFLSDYLFEEKLGTTSLRHEPIGVCALITPWNWPINQIAITDEDLVMRSAKIGTIFKKRLTVLQTKYPDVIGDIRCDRGAMMAIELVKNGDANQPNPELTAKLVPEAYSRGLVVLKCGVRGNAFRFLPALNISDTLINEGLDILEASFGACI